MYAIRSRITKQWLYGTDYREYPPIQRLSVLQAATFETLQDAENQFRYRKCSDEFEIVEVELREI